MEIILQLDLVELQASSFKETILEIVEIKENHPCIKLWLREAHRIIQTFSTLELKFWKG